MLDDLKYIHQRDSEDALGLAEKQWQQLEHHFSLKFEHKEITSIVFAGMGGSALAALLSTVWPGYTVPFYICRDYEIPAHVSKNTLFIASSYSGNTEETLEAIQKAEAKSAQIVIISSGGKLQEIAEQKGYPFEKLPSGLQPRHATFYSLNAYISVLERAGFVNENQADKQLKETANFLQEAVKQWLPTVPASKNFAKQLALECMGKSPVIYAGPKLFPAAYKWKINFNENSKNVAWCNQYPEFNHNEFMGWASHPVDKPYTVIDLRSNLEHERVQKRFEITERLLSGKRPAPEIVQAQGETVLQQLLWTVCLGDFVSLYLALLNGLNPTPVELIEKLKAALNG